MHIICKLFNFFLNMFNAVLTVVVEAITSLVGAAFTVLDAVFDGASSLLGKPITWLVLGAGAWWLLGGSDDEERAPKQNTDQVKEALNG